MSSQSRLGRFMFICKKKKNEYNLEVWQWFYLEITVLSVVYLLLLQQCCVRKHCRTSTACGINICSCYRLGPLCFWLWVSSWLWAVPWVLLQNPGWQATATQGTFFLWLLPLSRDWLVPFNLLLMQQPPTSPWPKRVTHSTQNQGWKEHAAHHESMWRVLKCNFIVGERRIETIIQCTTGSQDFRGHVSSH